MRNDSQPDTLVLPYRLVRVHGAAWGRVGFVWGCMGLHGGRSGIVDALIGVDMFALYPYRKPALFWEGTIFM